MFVAKFTNAYFVTVSLLGRGWKRPLYILYLYCELNLYAMIEDIKCSYVLLIIYNGLIFLKRGGCICEVIHVDLRFKVGFVWIKILGG